MFEEGILHFFSKCGFEWFFSPDAALKSNPLEDWHNFCSFSNETERDSHDGFKRDQQ
jgi:hypothetical protein